MTMNVRSWNNSVVKYVIEAHNISSGQLRHTMLRLSGPETLEVVTLLSYGEKHAASFLPAPSQTSQQLLSATTKLSGGVLVSANLTSRTARSRGIANTTPVFIFAPSVDIPGIATPSDISDGRSLLAETTEMNASIPGASIVSTLRPTATMATTARNLSGSVRLPSSSRIPSVSIHQAQTATLPNVTATTPISNLYSPVVALLVSGLSNQTQALTNTLGLAIVTSIPNPPTANTSRTASTSVQTVYVASFLSNSVTVDTYQASFILLSGLCTAEGPPSATRFEASAFAANVSKPSAVFSSILLGDNATSKSSTVASTRFTTSRTAIPPADSSAAAEPVFKKSKTAQLTKQQTTGVAVGGAACLIIALLITVFLARRCGLNKKRRKSTANTYEELKGWGDDAEGRGTICAAPPEATACTRLPRSAHTNEYGGLMRNMKDQYAQIIMERVVSVQHPCMFSDGCNAPPFGPYHSNVLPESPPSSTHSTVPPQTQFNPSLRTILPPTGSASVPPIHIGWNGITSDGHITFSDSLGSTPSSPSSEYSQ